jgi:hypothetical protein
MYIVAQTVSLLSVTRRDYYGIVFYLHKIIFTPPPIARISLRRKIGQVAEQKEEKYDNFTT